MRPIQRLLMSITLLLVLLCSVALITTPSASAHTTIKQVHLQPNLTYYSINFTASTAPIIVYARTGPGTNYSFGASLRPSTTLTFYYLSYGTLVNDYWTGKPDPRWYAFYSNGWYWIPSAQVAGNPPTSQLNKVNRAIAWAISQQGSQSYNGRCEVFVENAYGTQYQAGTAQIAYQHYHTSTNWSPNIGSLVWFVPNNGNWNVGHVGLYIGQNQFISATFSGVRTADMGAWSAGVAAYEGWGDAPASWPGR